MAKKKWYMIRKKGEKRWTAYELTDLQRKRVLPEYEVKGPKKSLLSCLIANRE